MRDDKLCQDVEDADMAEFPDAVKEAVSEAKVMIIVIVRDAKEAWNHTPNYLT